jgi:hypothetical protein
VKQVIQFLTIENSKRYFPLDRIAKISNTFVKLVVFYLFFQSCYSYAEQVVALPTEYVVYKDYVGSKSGCLLLNETLYIVVSTDEDIKIQELISDTGVIKKQYVLAIDLKTNGIKIVGTPGSYKADGYTYISGLMYDSNQLYVKTSNRYNVYDINTNSLVRNCSSDVYTNSYGIIHNGFMYSTSMGALDVGLDNIGIILKEEIDPEFFPDTIFTQTKFFLPYRKYVQLFGLDVYDDLNKDIPKSDSPIQLRYMTEAYRSEFILQDWIYLIANDTLYAASSFGTDFYVMNLQGDSISIHTLKGFENVRKNELEKSVGFVRTPFRKFSRLAKMLYDKESNNIMFNYDVSLDSRENKDDLGFYLIWSVTDNKEITGLRPIDYSPLKIEDNVITGLKVINDNDLMISSYAITTD